jgi:hypothetical protein
VRIWLTSHAVVEVAVSCSVAWLIPLAALSPVASLVVVAVVLVAVRAVEEVEPA